MNTNVHNLTSQDIESLDRLMYDLKNGKYSDIEEYNLSTNSLDFMADILRKALCPDKE